MKILAIRGKNIASLEGAFEVDFTQEPFCSTSLFAITGPTGSGKSSLLDTLCLALYDATPRSSRAKENNVSVPDISGRGLSQNDTRLLLRRGAVEAYAETDFIALSGERYRARWSLRRSRDRADGLLQNVTMSLFNLDRSKEEQGVKTELLSKIAELIGLSFEQFIRSVLLAQGDFANFLKAHQNEKAEILEKLTGTEIYSRLSVRVYQKFKESSEDLKQFEIRIEQNPLMENEEKARWEEGKKQNTEQLQQLKQIAEKLTSHLEWIRRYREIKESIGLAQQNRNTVLEEKDAFISVAQELEQIEQVQEIRDTFTDWMRNRKQLKEKTESCQRSKIFVVEHKSQVEQAFERVKCLRLEQAQWEQVFESEIQPRIEQAKLIEVQRGEKQKQKDVWDKEMEKNCQSIEAYQKEMAYLGQCKSEFEFEVKSQQQWIQDHIAYEKIEEKMSSLLDFITESKQAQQQQKINLDCAQQNVNCLIEEEKALLNGRKLSEKLAKVQPEELVWMRRNLKPGEACPVCGSLDHPWAQHELQTLGKKKQQLEEEREKIRIEIDRLTQSLSNRRSEIKRLEEMAQTYEKRKNELLAYLESSLSLPLLDWKKYWESDTLSEVLQKIIKEYKSRKEQKINLDKEWQECQLKYETKCDNHVELLRVQEQKKQEGILLHKEIDSLYGQYKNLFKEELISAVEVRYHKERNIKEQSCREAESVYYKLDSEVQKNEALEGQIQQEIDQLQRRVEEKESQIRAWLESHSQIETGDRLKTLLEIEITSIQIRKARKQDLQDRELQTKVVLEERMQSLEHHWEQVPKEFELQQQEQVLGMESWQKEQLDFINKQMDTLQQKRAEAEVLLQKDAENVKKQGSIYKEMEQARQKSERWAKLNEVIGSSDGSKFKLMAQAYTLDLLLEYANIQLKNLNKRYELQRCGDSLALQVVDWDMMGEIRSVHSLSGGESFLVSLALALGLSSLSSQRMKVESLFIDEGFGSLDADTLQVAMEALEQLHSQGRKIGVISHVTEMTEKISCKIRVEPTGGGGSKLHI